MKRLLFLIIAVSAFILSGCGMDLNMQYTPSKDLAEKYNDQVKDEYLTIYYTVKEAPGGNVLMMTVKNTGNIFMKNLSFNYDIDGNGQGSYNYKNIGNLKNRASKDVTIVLPKSGTDSVKFDYMFTPVMEDAFLNRDQTPGYVEVEPIKGSIAVTITK